MHSPLEQPATDTLSPLAHSQHALAPPTLPSSLPTCVYLRPDLCLSRSRPSRSLDYTDSTSYSSHALHYFIHCIFDASLSFAKDRWDTFVQASTASRPSSASSCSDSPLRPRKVCSTSVREGVLIESRALLTETCTVRETSHTNRESFSGTWTVRLNCSLLYFSRSSRPRLCLLGDEMTAGAESLRPKMSNKCLDLCLVGPGTQTLV